MTDPLPGGFFLGVNYPWVRYGQDFGRSPWGASGVSTPETLREVETDFGKIRDSGARVVRWFVFTDGRCGFLENNGIASGPDDLFFADVDAALKTAQSNQLQICFSLIDFAWLGDVDVSIEPASRARVLKFAAGRTAFLEKVLIPLFEKFSGHPSLFAWEVANEPEWKLKEFEPGITPRISLEDFRAFAGEVTDAIHEYAKLPATLGSARLIWMRAWSEIGLDWYQAHYYPQTERDQSKDLSQQLEELQTAGSLEKPLWMGELPAHDPSTPDYSAQAAFDVCKAAGLAGAALWRWREPEAGGSDVAFGTAQGTLLPDWLNRTPGISV